MKRLMQGIRTWPGCFDLMTDAFHIEEDRKSNDLLTERDRTAMIVSAALAAWAGVVLILWP